MPRMIRSWLFVLLCASLGLLSLALLFACNSPPATSDLPTPTQTPGVTALPDVFFFRQKQDPNVYMQALVEGELAVVDGCLRIGGAGGHVPIWPWNFALETDNSEAQVVDGDGRTVAQIGDRLRLSGGEAPAMPLVEDAARPLLVNCPGPYWIVGNEVQQVALTPGTTPSEPPPSSTPNLAHTTVPSIDVTDSPIPTVTPGLNSYHEIEIGGEPGVIVRGGWDAGSRERVWLERTTLIWTMDGVQYTLSASADNFSEADLIAIAESTR